MGYVIVFLLALASWIVIYSTRTYWLQWKWVQSLRSALAGKERDS